MMPLKEIGSVIEGNSIYSFTKSNEHQFYKTLLEIFNSTKDDDIWQHLHQPISTFVHECRK